MTLARLPENRLSKEELFLYLCKRTATIPFGYDPCIYSVPLLAECLGETKYRIRKLIKELETEGLVKKAYEGGINDEGYPGCYHGWSITKKARETTVYKQCYKDALEEFERFMREFDEKHGADYCEEVK